ncbi:hypothetical protein TorRG33x02_254640, partial [Trema orientale]
TQLRAHRAVGVDHVQGFGIFRSDDSLESSPHVRQLSIRRSRRRLFLIVRGRKDPGPHRNPSQCLHHVELVLRHVDPPNGVTYLPTVAVHGPHVLLEKLLLVSLCLALQGDSDYVVRLHFLVERARLHGELDDEDRHAMGVLLYGNAHSAFPVAEDCPRRRVVLQQRSSWPAEEGHHLAAGC